MKVEGPKPSTAPSKKRNKPSSTEEDGGLFSALLNKTESTNAPEATETLQPATSLLGIQEQTSYEDSRNKACQYANSILDELDQLHTALLTGHITEAQLTKLQQLLSRAPSYSQDPALAQTLQEISIRAAVELAKLGKSS